MYDGANLDISAEAGASPADGTGTVEVVRD